MNVLDLFSGAAGGWSLGMHRAGFRTVAACEADPWRRAVYGFNNPHVRIYDDIRTLTADRLVHDLGFAPPVIVGSPPCQDASTANTKGKGIDGERTGLFFEALRLVRDLRPRWVCLENVPGIRARGADRVLDELAAAGYAAWALVVGAVHAGAPHLRKRVVFIGHDPNTAPLLGPAVARREPDRADAGAPSNASQSIAERRGEVGGWCGRPKKAASDWPLADADEARRAGRPSVAGVCETQESVDRRSFFEAWPDWNGGFAGFGRVDDGIPKGMARASLAAYGDAFVPQITEQVGRAILAAEGVTA